VYVFLGVGLFEIASSLPQISPSCQVHKNSVEFRVQSEVQSHVTESSVLVQGKTIQVFTHLCCTLKEWFKM
jgi:hypothetical protein